MNTTIRRGDYRPPAYLVERVELDVAIDVETLVEARLHIVRAAGTPPDAPLRLDARELDIVELSIDGEPLAAERWRVEDAQVMISAPPAQFVLGSRVRLRPEDNTALEGFYASGPMYCTQCEAHGFSRITPFPDRPDVLSRYRVRLCADRARFPVLLANGNLVESGALDDGRHYAVWDDPYAKPCYLFAMVAGDLALVEDRYRTGSGRDIALRFYVDAGNEDRVGHAMDALRRSMAWDEARYGLEYDLDTYMVVAARAFNMGAMENKGLNVFNAAYVLASPETATDDEYDAIEAVIGHEYFHNYTGNRVTCRDWFQLSLKEGLTVFREQQFCAEQGSAGVRRIEQVRMLRAMQFPEDAGPTAHPVRPEAYVEVNNFYTATIYEKGAEIVRMLQTLLGDAAFNAGVRRYLREHDGRAATIEDFLAALASESGQPLDDFAHWYAQAGTPVLTLRRQWDADARRLRLNLHQHTPPTPGQPHKRPLPLPLRIRIWSPDGEALPLPAHPARRGDDLLLMDGETLTLDIDSPQGQPLPALLHGFSAPVRLQADYQPAELLRLATVDDDAFIRWEALQQLFLRAHKGLVAGDDGAAEALLIGLQRIAAAPPPDRALTACLLRFPDTDWLMDQYPQLDPDAFVAASLRLRQRIAGALCGTLSVWASQANEAADQAGQRALTNVALHYLAAQGVPATLALAGRRAATGNMTLALGALSALVEAGDAAASERDAALAAFRERWADEPLVLDKWFSLKAASAADAESGLRALLADPAFDWRHPNRVRAVLTGFSRRNLRAFHGEGGYAAYADALRRLDALNPQVAARLLRPLLGWRRLAQPWAGRQREVLAGLREAGLSRDLGELLEAGLA